jgi:hypothetical protein
VAMMERLLDEITDTERIQSLAKVIAHPESGQFKWNDIYLATGTPGQSYAGTFAGSDGANFFFRDDENRILVGNVKDLKSPAEPERKSASLLVKAALGRIGTLRKSSFEQRRAKSFPCDSGTIASHLYLAFESPVPNWPDSRTLVSETRASSPFTPSARI